jgi:hypothetical protein
MGLERNLQVRLWKHLIRHGQPGRSFAPAQLTRYFRARVQTPFRCRFGLGFGPRLIRSIGVAPNRRFCLGSPHIGNNPHTAVVGERQAHICQWIGSKHRRVPEGLGGIRDVLLHVTQLNRSVKFSSE